MNLLKSVLMNGLDAIRPTKKDADKVSITDSTGLSDVKEKLEAGR